MKQMILAVWLAASALPALAASATGVGALANQAKSPAFASAARVEGSVNDYGQQEASGSKQFGKLRFAPIAPIDAVSPATAMQPLGQATPLGLKSIN